MEVRKEVTTKKVVDYTCDICGKSCTLVMEHPCGPEFATLKAHWGYDSNKDTQEHECHMCEGCYDKVRKFIEEELGGKVIVYEYSFDGKRLGEWEE